MHAIEKSKFRHGQYVGYCNGVWHIRRNDGGWRATKRDGEFETFFCRTLREIDREMICRQEAAGQRWNRKA